MQTTYTGQRVRLRPFRSGEEGYLISCRVHQRLNPCWGQMWVPEAVDLRGFRNGGFIDPAVDSIFAVERIDTGELIGFEAGVIKPRFPLVGEVGTFIDPAHQRQGFGVEAKQLCMCFLFENFQINQVWGITLEHHNPARRGLELSGMSHIGSKRRSFFSAGKFRSMVFYRMWRSDWEEHQIRRAVKRGIAD